jgi:ribose 1,5-bisphosphokinase
MGGFVLVVGPSGAGKDTLLRLAQAKLASDARFRFPKRIVTRASSLWEDHDTLDEAAFEAAEKKDRFALSWRAHGLGYALPAAAIDAARCGQIVVCNVSRQVVAPGRRLLPEVSVVEVTAPPEILLARLAARGRSEDGDLKARVTRSAEIGDVAPDLTIENTGTPEAGAAELIRFLERRAVLSGAAADV